MQQTRRAATTGDAGILLYGLTALSSYTGTALVLRSKKREDCAAQGKISAHKAPAAGTACGGRSSHPLRCSVLNMQQTPVVLV